MIMLASIQAAVAGATPIPQGFNGVAGVVSLAENVSHIDATSKLVLNNGQICLAQSLALQAVEVLGLAPNGAIGAVTRPHFDSFRSKWSDTRRFSSTMWHQPATNGPLHIATLRSCQSMRTIIELAQMHKSPKASLQDW